MPNPNENKEDQQNFIEYDQNTHSYFVSQSIASCLLHLFDIYPAVAVEEKIEEFFKQSSLSDGAKAQAKALLDEPPNELDIVEVNETDPEGNVRTIKKLITLKETLALVYLAITDDSKWRAPSTRAERLENLDGVLLSFQPGLCHTGARNDSVSRCLNGYNNISLVMLDSDLILRCIKDFFYERLFSQHSWHDDFKSIILPWILTQKMPAELRQKIDNTFLADLKSYMEQNFSALNISISQDKALETQVNGYCHVGTLKKLKCLCIPDPLVHKLNAWVEESGVLQKRYGQPFIDMTHAVTAWLEGPFNSQNKDHLERLNRLIQLFDSLAKIKRFGSFLTLSGIISPENVSTIQRTAMDMERLKAFMNGSVHWSTGILNACNKHRFRS